MTQKRDQDKSIQPGPSTVGPALSEGPHGERHWRVPDTLHFCVRVFLGGVFVYASVDKILYPAAFAEIVYNYQVLPQSLINLTAIVLPWLELILGLFLILGLWLPGAVLLANLLLAIFLGAMIFNLARGLDIHCGCFRTATVGSDKAPMVWYVLRDGLFLVPAGYLFYRAFLVKGRFRT